MKHYYITTEPPIVCNDEEISNDCWFSLKSKPENCFYGENTFPKEIEILKVIVGLPNQLTIDYSALSDEDCKKIGWVDVEKLALKHRPNIIIKDIDIDLSKARGTWVKGFKTAQSLNNKKWSDKDIEEAFLSGQKYREDNACNAEIDINLDVNAYIEKINQPKLFEIEAIVQDNKVKILKVL